MVAKESPRNPKIDVLYFDQLDMTSFAALKRFQSASVAYTSKAVKSKNSAVKTLQRERILTKSGKFTKTYTASKA